MKKVIKMVSMSFKKGDPYSVAPPTIPQKLYPYIICFYSEEIDIT